MRFRREVKRETEIGEVTHYTDSFLRHRSKKVTNRNSKVANWKSSEGWKSHEEAGVQWNLRRKSSPNQRVFTTTKYCKDDYGVEYGLRNNNNFYYTHSIH